LPDIGHKSNNDDIIEDDDDDEGSTYGDGRAAEIDDDGDIEGLKDNIVDNWLLSSINWSDLF